MRKRKYVAAAPHDFHPEKLIFIGCNKPLLSNSECSRLGKVGDKCLTNVMTEKSLVDRYLSRARDLSGTPYSKQQLVERCERDITYDGRAAQTTVQLKGVRGRGLKKHRRLIPSGPLGVIRYVAGGMLNLEFPSVALLAVLDGDSKVFSALARYYTQNAEPPYPDQMTLELAAKFAHEDICVEIDQEVIEQLCKSNLYRGVPNAYAIIWSLLQVEKKTLDMRWKRVELAKWKSAGLTWPILNYERKLMPPPKPKPEGVLYRFTERHAKLLRLFDKADEAGKQHMEQAAIYAATSNNAEQAS